jgi:parallel beta-helix repeat protein
MGTVIGCLISNNSEDGVVLCQSELTLSDCIVTGSGENGIVDWCGGGGLSMSKCDISLNNGFGVDLGSGYGYTAATITNCVISENASTAFSYYANQSTGTLVNSTIADNGAFGIHYQGPGTDCSFMVANTIVRNNSGAEISADPGADATISVTFSNVEGGWPGAGNIDCNPDFVGSNDYHLLASSCCIDAGTSNGAPGEDMDGDVRPYDGGYDIGADEYYPIHAGFVVLNQEVYGSGMDIHILVTDSDLNTDLGQAEEYSDILTITTDHDGVIYDTESTITMTETGPATGVFMGSIAVANSSATSGNDVLEILCQTQENITATYHDTNDGAGNEAFPSDTAYTDCDSPEVSNIQVIHTEYPFATITWDTDEAADSCVYYGTTTALGLNQCQSSLVTEHTIDLSELLPGTTYYFAIGSVDEAGNQTLDNNNELYYQFTTLALAVYYVPDDYPTIQNAINARVSYDEIVVRPGTYYENINFHGKEISVRSEGGPAVTVIDGGGSGSVVAFTSGEEPAALLQGFTITNGDSDWEGGGIWFENFSSPTVDDCIITNNNSDLYGAGGIFCKESSPTITNCIISNNTCDFGRGGIFLTWYSSPTIANCTISNNIGTDGHGAGIYCYYYSAPTITNCIITGNSASQYGGGIYCHFSAAPTITNCTISDNFAQSGGGIYCEGVSAPTIVNSIVWDNTAIEGPGDEIYVDSDSTIDITYSDIKGGWSGGNINSDPLFMDSDNDDYRLQSNSPCIDAGNNGAPELLDYDFEGDTRIFDGDDDGTATVDMGADEVVLRARFSADVTSGNTPLTVQFADQSTGVINTREWDFDDNGTVDSTAQSPAPWTYSEAGDYTVSLTVTGLGGSDTETKTDYIQVYEDQPPNVPVNPSPANDATGVGLIYPVLSWLGGDPDPGDTVTYDLYFGRFNPPNPRSSNLAEPTFTLGKLLCYTTYYWKVAARDNNGAETPGPVWSFETTDVGCPVIEELDPNPCNPLDVVTITGRNFGSTKGAVKVGMRKYPRKRIKLWTDTRIDFKVKAYNGWPSETTKTKNVMVKAGPVGSRLKSNKVPLTITKR